MNFTFGIITTLDNPMINLKPIIRSIINLNIPNYEIIIIGGKNDELTDNIKIFKFEENPKGGWITKKKNLITKYAKYENIVYMHDYIIFDENWYKNFLDFKEDFKVCMNQILNPDNTRYRDWSLFDCANEINIFFPNYLLSYDIKYLSKLMYFSGAYWVAKKYVMEEFPLNEDLFWGQGEDVEWSKRIRTKYNFSINEKSVVKLIKYKHPIFELSNQQIDRIKEINNSKIYHNT